MTPNANELKWFAQANANPPSGFYHRPVMHADVWHKHGYRYPEPRNEVEGRIQHEPVNDRVARRAFYRLLLRFEPVNFFEQIKNDIHAGLKAHRARWYFRLIRLRNKMDLFPAVDKNTDVPF